MNASTARRDKHAHANPFFLSCLKRNEHSVPGFTPVTRFVGVELDRTIQEMEEISASEIARFRYGHFNRETLTKGIQVAESDVEFGLDDDCLHFPGLSEYSALQQNLLDIAIRWRRRKVPCLETSSVRICYVADCILAILALKRAPFGTTTARMRYQFPPRSLASCILIWICTSQTQINACLYDPPSSCHAAGSDLRTRIG
ncbi:hypothetical protein K443DRAFT_349147 [Laccaria amethystina LaAM-08-1]|uniref:Uncharacterized protein n=1 Tax=Laccaria amethystina LaAM-08-1 TaxID=1095629 RepID=A0A0C9WSQ5_9AGAR|nr:hypothetical protein K443DRAFT_349147 [Laccaria amethystina LaAM-08-1]